MFGQYNFQKQILVLMSLTILLESLVRYVSHSFLSNSQFLLEYRHAFFMIFNTIIFGAVCQYYRHLNSEVKLLFSTLYQQLASNDQPRLSQPELLAMVNANNKIKLHWFAIIGIWSVYFYFANVTDLAEIGQQQFWLVVHTVTIIYLPVMLIFYLKHKRINQQIRLMAECIHELNQK